MARYGVSIYGESFYGFASTALFAADPVVCTATDYGSILLTWHSPGGLWDELKVVRNFLGYPAAPENGVTVFDIGAGADPGEFRETGLPTDQWVYYTIFVHDPSGAQWVRGGNGRTFVPRDYNGGARFGSLLPEQMQSDALLAFMQIIGFNYDLLLNDGYTLLDLYATDRMSYDLVPVLMEQFGIPREFELEPEQYRRFLRNAVRLYKTKGTSECAHGVVASVTGWDSAVGIGANLLWDADFSDFAGSTAYWGRGEINCNVTYVPVGTDDLDEVVPPAMRMTAVTDGEIETTFVDLAVDSRDLHWLGLPVVVGASYFASAFIQGSDIDESPAHLELRWYDLMGNLVSASTGAAVVTRQFVDVMITVGDIAPTNAVWMVPVVVVDDAHAASYWDVRTIQVSRSDVLLAHEYGRDIKIALKPNRINEVLNGSFEVDLTGWSTTGDTTIAQDDSQAFIGTHSLALTYTGAGVTDAAPIPTDYASCSVTTIPGRRYGVQVEVAHDGNGSPLDYLVTATNAAVTDVLLDSDGSLATAQTNTDGTANTLGGTHDEPSFAFVAEETTTTIVVGFIDAATGAVLNLDAVIVEVADTGTSLDWQTRNPAFVQPYFDASIISLTLDYFWEGVPFESRSHFYDRRIVHQQRLEAILPRYLPFGATFTLLFAQPDAIYYASDDTILVDREPPAPTAPVGRSLTLDWINEFDSGGLVALRWTARAAVSKDLSIEWNDRTLVGADSELEWGVAIRSTIVTTVTRLQQTVVTQNTGPSPAHFVFPAAVQPGDVVVICYERDPGTPIGDIQLSGLGATWHNQEGSPNSTNQTVAGQWWGVAQIAGTTITLNHPADLTDGLHFLGQAYDYNGGSVVLFGGASNEAHPTAVAATLAASSSSGDLVVMAGAMWNFNDSIPPSYADSPGAWTTLVPVVFTHHGAGYDGSSGTYLAAAERSATGTESDSRQITLTASTGIDAFCGVVSLQLLANF